VHILGSKSAQQLVGRVPDIGGLAALGRRQKAFYGVSPERSILLNVGQREDEFARLR
jgi:hypothetical protein